MTTVEEFLKAPSEAALNLCSREDLVELAEHYKVDVGDRRKTENMRRILTERLLEVGVLKSEPAEQSLGPSAAAPLSPSKEDYLTFEQRKQLLELECEMRAHDIKRLQLEERVRQVGGSGSAAKMFDIRTNLRLVPPFNERDPDTFFVLFERVADDRQWSDADRTLLLQCMLTGRAQEAYSSLTVADSRVYTKVKAAVLKAFELVPEAYRLKFRTWEKTGRQTSMEFVRDLTLYFNRWCSSLTVNTYESLCDLIVLEQFKNSLPVHIASYLSEHKVKTAAEAAALVDEYVLTHRVRSYRSNDVRAVNSAGSQSPGGFWDSGSSPRQGGPFRSVQGSQPFELNDICNYCKQRGHWKADCPLRRAARQTGLGRVHPNALVVPLNTLTGIEMCGGVFPTPSAACPFPSQQGVHGPPQRPDFSAFLSNGYVSLVPDGVKVPVRILRDTGSFDSFIVGSVLPFSQDSDSGDVILVRGMGLKVLSVPVHKFMLDCGLFQGEVSMGVRPALPIEGVHIIVGNGLAGSRVWADVPSPIVTASPVVDSSDSILLAIPNVFTACAVTRSRARKQDEQELEQCHHEDMGDVSVPESLLSASRGDLVDEQRADATLGELFENVLTEVEGRSAVKGYMVKDGLLVRKWMPHGPRFVGPPVYQIVLPTKFRQEVLRTAHDQLGHLGVRKTYAYILNYFFWPRLKRAVSQYVKTCHTCQITGKPNQTIKPAPLSPILVTAQPFEHLIIDCVGPLPQSKTGCKYMLTVMCQSTRYPAAYPLRVITARSVVKALTQFIAIFGIPKVVQSDQGSNFSSQLFSQILKRLGIRHNQSSAYHAQSQGALERFHQTLKALLRCYCVKLQQDWEEGLPWLLLAARGVVQESTGYSPNELVFGHTVRGPLAVLCDSVTSSPPPQKLADYVNGFRRRLCLAGELAKEALASSQAKMKRLYDRGTEVREFSPGDQVLALLPLVGSPFQARFSGPFTVLGQTTALTYLLQTPGRRKKTQLCHVNLLRPYYSRAVPLSTGGEGVQPPAVNPVLMADTVRREVSVGLPGIDDDDGVNAPDECRLRGRLRNSETLASLESLLGHLSPDHSAELTALIREYVCLFGDVPTRTHLLEHDIDVGDSQPIRQRFYRVSESKRSVMESEVKYMLENDIAQASSSSWASPCLLVDKADGSPRFCTDYRKVNMVTKPDAYPLPRMEDCIDQVGAAKFVSKFDLLKGYWQVPLTARAREVASFITPFGLYSYSVMSFGLRNAPATFQRLMNLVVAGLEGCAVYLDDAVVYSDSWEVHLARIRNLFDRLRAANLTVNLAKCEFARATVTYLGKQVGQGEVRPLQAKVEAIKMYPAPSTKKELMRFLGLVGYYRSFCRNFSSVVAPLTDLLKARAKYIWSEICQQAFEKVKSLLCVSPVLAAPCFTQPFILQVDASDVGAGAVLLQADDSGVERPVSYFSRKFNAYQLHYSVIEKETLSLVWALQHFEVYVDSGVPVVVYTDHNPITFLHSLFCPNRRLLRWFLFLQSYCLEIHHIKGSDNLIADALSRAV